MTEIRNVAADASRLRLRVLAVGLVVFLAFCLIVARLVFLQVVRHGDLAGPAGRDPPAPVPPGTRRTPGRPASRDWSWKPSLIPPC